MSKERIITSEGHIDGINENYHAEQKTPLIASKKKRSSLRIKTPKEGGVDNSIKSPRNVTFSPIPVIINNDQDDLKEDEKFSKNLTNALINSEPTSPQNLTLDSSIFDQQKNSDDRKCRTPNLKLHNMSYRDFFSKQQFDSVKESSYEENREHEILLRSMSYDSNRMRSFSADWSKFSSKSIEKRLLAIKKQTDEDVKHFLKDLQNFSEKHKDIDEHCLKILESLKLVAKRITNSSFEDLKNGEYRKIMNKLQKLNSIKNKETEVEKECSKMIRKLAFIFSRITRYLGYLNIQKHDALLIKDESVPENQKYERRRLKSIAIVTNNNMFKTSVPIDIHKNPIEKPPLSPPLHTQNKPSPQQIKQTTTTPKLPPIQTQNKKIQETKPASQEVKKPVSPVKKTESKWFFQRVYEKWKSWTEKKPESPKSSRSVVLLCRICENLVNSEELEEHSKICAIKQSIDMKSITCDDRLKKLENSIKKRKAQARLCEKKKITDPKKKVTLSHQEIVFLNRLASISRRASQLEYTNESLSELSELLDEIKQIGEDTERLRIPGMTVQIYTRRIEEIMKQKYSTMEERIKLKFSPTHYSRKKRTKITDFTILKPISRGAYGRVFLARKKKTGDLYAIKVLNKDEIWKRKQTKRLLAERNVMAISEENDFVVKLYYSFQGKDYYYLVMEYCSGGDLFSLLRKQGYFEVDMARNYCAELVLALEFLHKKGIVHRDLKPDNLLINHDGHLKLTDFGLSDIGLIHNDPFLGGTNGMNNSPPNNLMSPNSSLTEETSTEGITVCGTPDYLSPELLLGTGHEYTVDWWAVGVILFEMLTGCPPFNDETPELIFDNILSCKIPWPEEGILPDTAVDLIKKLLVVDPKKRLGYNGAEEVKRHPFFKGIKWDKLLKQRPPYVPYIENEESTQHFAPRQSIFVVEDSNIDDTEETESGEMTEEPTNVLSNNSSFEDMLSPMSQSPIDFSFVSASNLAEKNKQVFHKMESTIPERSP